MLFIGILGALCGVVECSAGLVNMGNTCYMNSVLQYLFNAPLYRERIIQTHFLPGSVGDGIKDLFRDMRDTTGSVMPFEVVQRLGIDVRIQQDSQEFLLQLLNEVDSSVSHFNRVSDPPSRCFRGYYENVVKCISVPFQRQHTEEFVDISVDMRNGCDAHQNICDQRTGGSSTRNTHQNIDTLDKALSRLLASASPLQGENAYDTGTALYGTQDAEHTLRLDRSRLPGALMIHLKRFKYVQSLTTGLWRSEKVHSAMALPLTLDLSPYLNTMTRKDLPNSSSNISTGYVLDSIISHTGSAERGHYVCFVRENSAGICGNVADGCSHEDCSGVTDSTWLKYDDDRVSRITFNEVCRACFGGNVAFCGALGTQIGQSEQSLDADSALHDNNRHPGTAYIAMYSAINR